MAKQQNKNQRPGLEVRRKDNESTGSLARRFVQKVRRSGTLMEVRNRQYYKKDPNKRARRDSALVRAERREKYKKMRKWGKLNKK